MNGVPVRLAIAGVGNCASVFLQGLEFYSGKETGGLWHPVVGGLRPRDIEVVAGFDIDARKVGRDLADAMFQSPNVARRYLKVPRAGTKVAPGVSKGDDAPHLKGARLLRSSRDDVSSALSKSGAQMLVNMISSGSDASSSEYALAAADAGCAYVNCTPSLVLKVRKVVSAFARAKLPLVGDDLMSQFGGTVFHKGLLGLMVRRGVKISKSYQLDVGGGSETLNTIDEDIKMAKRQVKTSSVSSEVPYKFETVAGTTDYVDYMGNERTSYFWFEGSSFMNSGTSVDVYLRSSDGANAGNVLFDVVRATSRVMKTGKLASVQDICAYGFKSPPKRVGFEPAYNAFVKSFIGN